MSNEELYKSTLNKVHVPKAVLGKVGEMNKERKTMRRRYVLQYAAYAIVMGGILFAATNGICYAATGETLIKKVDAYINGEKVENGFSWYREGDEIKGKIKVPLEEEIRTFDIAIGDPNEKIVPENLVFDVAVYGDDGEPIASSGDFKYVHEEDEKLECDIVCYDPNDEPVKEKDGRIIWDMGDEEYDITDDFADGEASVVIDLVETPGTKIKYTITGTIDDYEWDVEEIK